MKIRGMKQVLHWLFLAVGLLSVLAMAVSVRTYLGYADNGYGLTASVADAWLSDDSRLWIRLDVENPGGLDIQMGGSGASGNLTLGDVYPVALEFALIKADNSTYVILHTDQALSTEDLERINQAGSADIVLNLRLYVPERDMATYLRLEAEGTEVRP